MRVERARHLLAGIGLAVIVILSAGGPAAASDTGTSIDGCPRGCHDPIPQPQPPPPPPEPEPLPPQSPQPEPEPEPEPPECPPEIGGIGWPGGSASKGC